LRIAVLAPEIFPSWGGVGSYTYNLIHNLPEDIHYWTDRVFKEKLEKLLSRIIYHCETQNMKQLKEIFGYRKKSTAELDDESEDEITLMSLLHEMAVLPVVPRQ